MAKNEIEKQRIGHSDLKDILPDLLAKEPIIGNKQFYSMDGKVLRFYAILDDTDQQDDDWRKFIIHVSYLFERTLQRDKILFILKFYLVDNTVEVREIHKANDGYEPKSIYLNRQLVSKDSTYNISKYYLLS